MEEETQVNLEINSVQVPVTKVDENTGGADINPPTATVQGGEMDIPINGDLHQTAKAGNKEEEEEIALDGEFIKVERESFDVKGSSHTEEAVAKGHSASVIEQTSSNSMESRDSIESNEKMKALQLELERVARDLHQSELEKAQLKEDVVIAKEKLEKKDKHCEDLELSQKKLQDEIRKSEEKYKSQLDALQEAFGTQETKHKELIGVKEAFDGLTVELETSRKKMQELEQELQSSASDACKFEELSKQSDSHAKSESQKALEFQSLLEMAKSSAKEMEDQMASLQEELKGLYEKIAENKQTEEALNSTVAELSMVRGELELSQSQVLNMEQKLASNDVAIKELTLELNTRKASEEQMKGDIMALENLFSSAKEDLQAKVAKLDEIEMKLQEEVKMRKQVEAILKNQEAEISSVQGELAKMTGEKAFLEAAMEDLNGEISQKKELCSDLETKLKLSDDNFCKTDSLLSQAVSHNAELEEKIKSLETLHQESGTVAATATQRNLELEDIIRASSVAEEEAKSQLRDIEMRLISVEQKNIELEQQLNLAQLKNNDVDRELKEYSEKTSELMALLTGVEEESAQLKMQLKEYEEKITNLESTLNLSSLRNSELEQELKDIAEKCAEHEGQASMKHQRGLELEELIQVSHSKAEDAEKRVGEVELLLESSKYRLQELEEQISISKNRCQDVEAEAKQYSDRVSELTADLEIFQVKSSNLEIALQAANEKERTLMESLNVAYEELKKYEDAEKISSQKLSETENLTEVLKNELKLAQDKLESIEKDLKASGIRESEIMEKLNSAEEQLEEQGKMMEQATARSSELDFLHESLVKDSEAKLREVMESFNQKDLEAADLRMMLNTLEDKGLFYQERIAEAAEKEASLRSELEESSVKLVSQEEIIDGLKSKVLEAEQSAGQSFLKNELLVETNLKLKQELETNQIKINELQELLSAVHVEKEGIAEQLDSHMKTVTELTDQHSRGLELQSAAESRIREAELRLQEAIERFTQRDSDAKDLNEKLTALETQIKISEEHADQAVATAESRKAELEEALLKLNQFEGIVGEQRSKASQFETENEGLVKANLKLTQELAAYETKMNELQTALSAAFVEKEDTFEQLQSSKKTIEDLTQQFAAEGHKLQTQVTELTDQHSRGLELQSAAESRIREAELRLKEAIERFSQRDSDAKDLNEKLTALETQIKISEEHADQAVATAESRKAELEEALLKLNQFEGIVGELRSKASQFETENEGLAEANLKLTQELAAYETKMNELQTALSAAFVEKEDTFEQLQSSKKTIEDLTQQFAAEGHKLQTQVTELTDQHSRGLELQSAAESRIREAELQLQEAIERFSQRDSDAKDLNEKLNALETQIKISEEHANQAIATAESRKAELEEALLKLNQLEGIVGELRSKASEFETENEGLAEANLKLTQELAAYETKMNELQTALNASFVEKEETFEQLQSSKKTVEDLTQQLSAEGHKLQTQISSVMEENNMLTKSYQDANEELQVVMIQLERQLSEHKERENALCSDVENLKTELTEKSVVQTHIAELQEQLLLAKTHLKEEVENLRAVAAEKEAGLISQLEENATKLQERDVLHEQVALLQKELDLAHTTIAEQKEADSRKEVDREAALKLSQVEIEAKQQHTVLLSKQVEELQQKLQLAEEKYLKKDKEGIQVETKDGVEVKSRDLGSMASTLPKRKHKKRTEAMSSQAAETSPAGVTQTTEEHSLGLSIKFILGVALVSVIIGVILGKRY